MTASQAMAPTRPASLFVTVLVGAIVLAGVPSALVSGVALPVYFGDALPEIALLPLMVAFVAVPGSTAGV
jgi:hypothetical protein